MVFQSKDTLIHQLYDRQLETLRQFLACFVKSEHLTEKSLKQLQQLDLLTKDDK